MICKFFNASVKKFAGMYQVCAIIWKSHWVTIFSKRYHLSPHTSAEPSEQCQTTWVSALQSGSVEPHNQTLLEIPVH